MARNTSELRVKHTSSGGKSYVQVVKNNKTLKSFGRVTNHNYLQANAFRALYIAFHDWLDDVVEDSYDYGDVWMVALEQFGPHLGRDLINKSIREQFRIEEVTISIADDKKTRISLTPQATKNAEKPKPVPPPLD